MMGFGFSVTFILGCATAAFGQGSVVGDARAADGGGGWEYNCSLVPSPKMRAELEEELNALGREGWEVTSEYCAKRPMP